MSDSTPRENVMHIDTLPTYFLSHGGGPWSFVDEPSR